MLLSLSRRTLALTAYILLIGAVGCAHLEPKTQAINGLQATMLATGSAQDFEVAAYTNKTLPGYTDEQHLAMSQAFVKIFDVQAKAATALDAWRAGDPAPSDVVTYAAAIREALAVAQQVAPVMASPVAAKIQTALDAVQRVLTAMQGGN